MISIISLNDEDGQEFIYPSHANVDIIHMDLSPHNPLDYDRASEYIQFVLGSGLTGLEQMGLISRIAAKFIQDQGDDPS